MNNPMPTFATLADAHAAGWLSPRGTGPWTYSHDVSGGRSFGYAFELHLTAQPGGPITTADSLPAHLVEPVVLGRTRTVRLTAELNGIRQPGCYAALYPPSVRDAIWVATVPLHEARTIVDQARRERRDRKAVLRGQRQTA